MALSGAERARRCREKKKAAGLGKLMKQRNRKRKRFARSRMSSIELKAFRLCQQTNLRKFRSKAKPNPILPSPSTSSFSTKQSKAKALKRILNVLPVNKDKQVELIQQIAEDLQIVKLEKKLNVINNLYQQM